MPKDESQEGSAYTTYLGLWCLAVFIILLGVYGLTQGWYGVSDSKHLSLNVSPTIICSGDLTNISVSSNLPNAQCLIAYNFGSQWKNYRNIILSANGTYSESSNISAMGSAMLSVACANGNDTIKSEYVLLTLNNCSSESACTASGGTLENATCCLSSGDFPNTCLIRACGCSPANSHSVLACNCGEGKCWDGKTCKQL